MVGVVVEKDVREGKRRAKKGRVWMRGREEGLNMQRNEKMAKTREGIKV